MRGSHDAPLLHVVAELYVAGMAHLDDLADARLGVVLCVVPADDPFAVAAVYLAVYDQAAAAAKAANFNHKETYSGPPGARRAGVAQPGQRRKVQDLISQEFVGSNPISRTMHRRSRPRRMPAACCPPREAAAGRRAPGGDQPCPLAAAGRARGGWAARPAHPPRRSGGPAGRACRAAGRPARRGPQGKAANSKRSAPTRCGKQ